MLPLAPLFMTLACSLTLFLLFNRADFSLLPNHVSDPDGYLHLGLMGLVHSLHTAVSKLHLTGVILRNCYQITMSQQGDPPYLHEWRNLFVFVFLTCWWSKIKLPVYGQLEVQTTRTMTHFVKVP